MMSNFLSRARATVFGALVSLAAGAAGLAVSSTPAAADSAGPWLRDAFASQVAPTQTSRVRRIARPSVRVARLGSDDESTSSRRRSRGVRTASLGKDYTPPSRQPRLSGGSVNWVASSGCLNATLKSAIYAVAAQVGPVRVSSTCRSASHNRRIGGASRSYHLTGNAADFRVFGSASAAMAVLRASSVGGLKHYGGGLFHIDTGPRRSW